MSLISEVKAVVAKAEKSKLAEQLFRAVRLAAVGLIAYAVSGNAITSTGAIAAVEVAFRQVFPSTP